MCVCVGWWGALSYCLLLSLGCERGACYGRLVLTRGGLERAIITGGWVGRAPPELEQASFRVLTVRLLISHHVQQEGQIIALREISKWR